MLVTEGEARRSNAHNQAMYVHMERLTAPSEGEGKKSLQNGPANIIISFYCRTSIATLL